MTEYEKEYKTAVRWQNMKFAIMISLITTAAIVLNHQCTPSVKSSDNTVKRDTLWIAAPQLVREVGTIITEPKVENYYNEYVTHNGPVDTGAVIRDYFSKRTYKDTSRTDSIEIYVQESVFKNELIDRKLSYKWKAPSMLVKETTILEQPYWNAGGFAGIGKNYASFGISGGYACKWGYLGAGYDFLNRAPVITFQKRIKFKK